MTTLHAPIHATRGTTLRCKGWRQEAALRMLMNNLDPEVAERDHRAVYVHCVAKKYVPYDNVQSVTVGDGVKIRALLKKFGPVEESAPDSN